TVVRRNVRARAHQRKKDRRRAAGNAWQRDALESGHCVRAPGDVSFDGLAVLPEVESAPVRVVEHSLLAFARALRIALDVGPEGRFVLEDCQQLRAYFGGRSLDLVEPVKPAAVVELDLRQLGKVVIARLLDIDVPAAEKKLE